MSTRPFLKSIEKTWIAFQLLLAIQQAHKHGICHGDIKLENVLVTSWNWVFLTDFASFKPTFLPEDNPAAYSFFFDSSRRRWFFRLSGVIIRSLFIIDFLFVPPPVQKLLRRPGTVQEKPDRSGQVGDGAGGDDVHALQHQLLVDDVFPIPARSIATQLRPG